jgi:hypothetical protein
MAKALTRLAGSPWGRLMLAALLTLAGIGVTSLIGLVLGRMAPLPDRVLAGMATAAILVFLLPRYLAAQRRDDGDDG